MYTIKRNNELFLSDKKYPTIFGTVPIWQGLNGSGNIFIDESLEYVTDRRNKLQEIYKKYSVEVYKLSDEELEFITFRKIRGY